MDKLRSSLTIRLGHVAVALFFVLWLCGACRQGPQGGASAELRNFTDGLGRKVAIRANPQRIVSLAPSVTETLFALGLGDRVIGVTSYCNYPDGTKAKEKIGDTLHPDFERIIVLKPDLVLITTASQLQNLTSRLDQLAIPVYVTNPRTVRETVASIRELGEVTGSAAQAAKVADEMDRRISAVESQVKSLAKPRVLYVLQIGPLITAGRATFINDLINLAGGQSISGEETADYPQFSRETVIARAPEVIVAPGSHGTEFVAEADLRRDFAVTPAVRLNRIVRVDPDLIDRPGPRLVIGLEEIARGLHPDNK